MTHRVVLLSLVLCSLAGCAHGNLHTGSSRPIKPPKVAQSLYDPYAPYGSTPARWAPSTGTYDGSIVKPADPVDQSGRPDYEHAQWSVQHSVQQAGTF